MKLSAQTIRIALVVFGSVLAGSSIFAAAVFDPSTTPYWQAAPFTLKSTKLSDGATKAYQPWYENGSWQGDLIEFSIATNGARTTGSWTARAVFADKESTVADYWKARKIITHDGSSQVAFRWNLLAEAQALALDADTAADILATGAYDSPILNFIRGDRSLEGTYRTRFSLLGDIIHSQPVYVGGPSGDYTLAGYATFKDTHKNRGGRLYVGANDGMVHVFNAQDGSEVYAYVPSMLLSNLEILTSISYYKAHTYYADGQLVYGDAQIGSDWLTLLAGGLGSGGKGLFALDITNPDLSDETASTGNDAKILWERTGTSLGYIYGRPRVAKLPDGNWYVVSGNGFGSDDGIAKLVLAPVNGDAASYISTAVGSGNGLAAAALVDTDHDGDADYAYAGDIQGNLWKFDLANTTASKLFAAGDSQPITTAPEVTKHPHGGRLIYFGTGSLLSDDDALNTDQQTIYAIWDKPGSSSTVATANLQQQTLTAATHADGTDVRMATSSSVNWSTQYGWKVNLPGSGERLLGNPQLRDQRLVIVTHAPDRAGWLMGLDWFGGGETGEIQFDLDADNALDNDDRVTIDGNARAPVGRLLGTANYAQPAIAQITNGSDILYINGFTLPLFDTCTGDCTGGLIGGHVDVDSDAASGLGGSGLGGSTDAHKHEYDDSFDITYMDYFELLNGVPFDDVVVDWDLEFVPILANSDLSPGGVITIGPKEWNAVEYQEIVQQALEDWDGSSPLLDDDGDSLVHTINSLKAGDGTIKISFDDQAIVSGGLIPTETGCVKSDPGPTNGRWRNGALTIHMLRFDEIKAGAAADNVWVAQDPTDLVEGMVGGGVHANLDNPAGFLYESTLFWHWGGSDLADELGVDYGKCYAEDGWAEAWEVQSNGMTEEIFDQLYPDADYDAVLELAIQLQEYECEDGVGEACEKEDGYKDLLDILKDDYDINTDHLTYLGRGSGVGAQGTSDGASAEADVQDMTEDLSPVPGPAFTWGRRAWIDL